jgi:catechol 2,3-dioxygenase-like lactoylglutathione lyase family enzyme
MLKSIIIVTISVLNLGNVETAYQEQLDYQTVERGVLSESLTAVWDTPSMTGRDYLLMQPDSREEVYLRFIENSATEGHEPMTTFGWNATELLVKDPDALATKLMGSAFRIIGPPEDLWAAPDAPRAMQVKGPGDEVLYLTRNLDFEFSGYIDRVFIMVVGGPSMDAFRDYYANTMGLKVGEATPFQISVISNAQGLPADTTYPLAVARISERFLIELDEYPAAAGARPLEEGKLPPGTAMVSFEVEDLDALDVELRAAPGKISALPYRDRRSAVTVGPAGEWIELIETGSSTD